MNTYIFRCIVSDDLRIHIPAISKQKARDILELHVRDHMNYIIVKVE